MHSLIDQITELAQRWRQQLVLGLLLVIAIGISLCLASSVIFFLEHQQGPDTQIGQTAAISQPETQQLSAKQLAALNLFGDPTQTKAPVATNIQAPETRLRLELQGVVTGGEAEQNSAIIAEKGKSGLLYLVGASVPGNATLHAVYDDRVILKRGTRLETLNFPKTLGKNAFQAVTSRAAKKPARPRVDATPSQASNITAEQKKLIQDAMARGGLSQFGAPSPEDFKDAESIADFLAQNLDQIEENSEQLLSALGVQSDDDGAYTISASALPQSMLAQAGLRNGDTIRSINGLSVAEIQQDQSAMQGIVASCKARVEVQRGKRRFFVTAALC